MWLFFGQQFDKDSVSIKLRDASLLKGRRTTRNVTSFVKKPRLLWEETMKIVHFPLYPKGADASMPLHCWGYTVMGKPKIQ